MSERGPIGDLFRLDGRVALVTGAGGAFGRAIARGFAEFGARLLLTDLDATGLELAYMIRARDEARVVTAIEQHLEASYARVLASYPDKATELRLLR
jgi:NAD(P)-dependent dehydrogenase (short-subunit alcohol dehydrogenase family)